MSRDLTLRQALRAARPLDPTPEEGMRSAVRVLARVAVLEAGAHALPPAPARSRARVLVVAGAASLLVGVALLVSGGPRGPGTPPPSAPAATDGPRVASLASWRGRVAAALAGDDVQRRRVVHGGIRARRAILLAAEEAQNSSDDARPAAALALLEAAGALRGEAEASRVARLAADPRQRLGAVRLLAGSLGPYGVSHLRTLLVEDHEAEAHVVPHLVAMATRGRRDPALRGLLEGTAHGRVLAAAAALRIGGAADLPRVLKALPRTLRGHAVMAQALATAPVTTRVRLLRLAGQGDAAALELAATARVRGIVPRLAVEAQQRDAPRARRAVALLGRFKDVRAVLALARAFDGAAGAEARAHVRAAEASLDGALFAHAQDSPRDGSAVVTALGERGAGGLTFLSRLARDPRLATLAVGAIERSVAAEAAAVLAQLIGRVELRGPVLEALGRRLGAGDTRAGSVLLGLAQQGHARAVLRVLRASGDAGRDALDSQAGRALARAGARSRRLAPRPSRSI